MKDYKLKFPKGFMFGTATAAYQIEGAWNEDGKGESVWDRHVHDANGKVSRNETADVAIDHYHRYQSDFDILKEIGTNAYRFSIAWTRILPEGTGKINQKGIDFYNNIIDALIARGITPVVTLFHWDLPAALQEKGGWANPECIGWFSNYAKICFENFGDRVKYWITLNETYAFTFFAYGAGFNPPCIKDFKMAIKAAHNALVAHGTVVRLYHDLNQGGKIGIALDLVPKLPFTDDPKDIEAAEIANGTTHFFFYEALLYGHYPKKMVEVCTKKHLMPEINPEDFKIITEKCDFLGVNFYYTQAAKYVEGAGRFDYQITARGLPLTMGDWELDPEGFMELLKRLKKDTNGEIPIIITENGFSPADRRPKEQELEDDNRIEYLSLHLGVLHKAIEEGLDIRGYMLWSAFDNFEWNCGFGPRFGLVHVDYDTLERTRKKSSYWYQKLIEYQDE